MKSTFIKRQKSLQAKLKSLGVDGYLCDEPIDIFYLTGMQLSLGRLLVCQKAAILLVDRRYADEAKKHSHCQVGVLSCEYTLSLLATSDWKEVRSIGFDTRNSFGKVEEFKALLRESQKKRRLKKAYQMKGLKGAIERMRAIKDLHEINLIKKSASLLWEGFLSVKKELVIGIEEREVALAFECYCRKKGAEKLSFSPIVAFGANTAFPHHHTGKKRLKRDEIVLMDLGVQFNGYASDMTRTFFFGKGKLELQKLYRVVEQSKKAALEICCPGVTLSQLDEAAREVMRKEGLEKHFLHTLGHGIGLDVHELPNFRAKDEVLEEGMVITIEPGLYLPGKGGVRLEDMVIVTKNKHQNLFD